MKTSPEAIKAIKDFEGFRPNAYQDAVGVWTIGYGSTKGVKAGQVVTEPEASGMLLLSAHDIETGIPQDVHVALTQRQFDAIVDFEYNLGRGSFDHSTLLKLLNSGDYQGAANEFPRWCHAGDKVLAGLLHRRLTEQSWFLDSISQGKL